MRPLPSRLAAFLRLTTMSASNQDGTRLLRDPAAYADTSPVSAGL